MYQIDTDINDLKETTDKSNKDNIQPKEDLGNYWANYAQQQWDNAVIHY